MNDCFQGLRLAVAVPVYNHAATLPQVVAGARDMLRKEAGRFANLELFSLPIVVDDGSTDAPEKAMAGQDAVFLRHEKNLGKGAAIRTAAGKARELGCSHLVTLDADGQHDPEDLAKFFAAVAERPFALFVGERDFDTLHVPGASRFGRSFSNFWLRVHTGRKLGDSQSGFRAYPLAALLDLDFNEDRYAFEVEVLVRAAWAGLELVDIPIRVHYPEKASRVSHFKAFQDNARISWLNTRLTFRSVLPWPHQRLVPEDAAGECVSAGFRPIHPLDSVRDLVRTGVPPKEVALSGGLGMLIGCLPLPGLQTITVITASGYLGRNRFIALGVNQLCMPPIMPALCIEAGHFLRHGSFLTEISIETLGYQAPQRLLEWLLGGVVLGPVFALLTGGVLYVLAHGVKKGNKVVRKNG